MGENEIMQNLLNAHRRLGIRLTSSDDEVKSAYRKLAFELHPDRKGISPNAGDAAFKQVQQDFETIRQFRDIHRAAEQAAAATQSRSAAFSQASADPPGAVRTAQAAAGAQQAGAQKAASALRFGRSGIAGTLGIGALLVGAGLLIETVKYKYVKPKIENSTIVRRMSGAVYGDADARGYIVAAPMERQAQTAESTP